MSLSRMAKSCQACPYVDNCDHKMMEALGVLPGPPVYVSPKGNLTDAALKMDDYALKLKNLSDESPVAGVVDMIYADLQRHIHDEIIRQSAFNVIDPEDAMAVHRRGYPIKMGDYMDNTEMNFIKFDTSGYVADLYKSVHLIDTIQGVLYRGQRFF